MPNRFALVTKSELLIIYVIDDIIVYMKIEEVLNKALITEIGDFESLRNQKDSFGFSGVYILCDNDEVVYVGSAYARNIRCRLLQYLNENDSGNTLGKTIAKCLSNSQTYDKAAESKLPDAIQKIKSLKIYAIKHEDLEYFLIKCANPKFNKNG